MNIHRPLRMAAAGLAAGLSLLLTGCFISPGKFTSELILTEENHFTFTYEGEIFFLGLSNLAEIGAAADEFTPNDCYDEDTFAERDCTEAELADQRAAWDANAGVRAAEAAQQAEQMSAMMGGIDPSDPEAADELTLILLRQKGWDRVENKGDGLFDVSYSVSGELSHDFMFPVIEDFPMINPFVQFYLRDGGLVRVNAPGFAAQNGGSPMGGMIGGMAGMALLGKESGSQGSPEMPNIPEIEGTFTVVTNGIIRANNTDEGAAPTARGDELVWKISPRTQTAPTALIDMSR